MKVLIVEDSRLARKELIELLSSFAEIEIIGEAGNSQEALAILNKQQIDLMFLDINMPGKNGFELLDMLESIPKIIFTTAYNEYALKSFEYNTIDYLLKPIKQAELERAIIKARNGVKLLNVDTNDKLNRIFIKEGTKCWLVDLADIVLFESEGNYSRVYFENVKPLIYKSLNIIETKLDQNLFFRANRHQLINLNKIKSFKSDVGSFLRIVMKNDMVIEVSRRNAIKLKTQLSL